jgi:hypothetical protein
MKNFFSQTWVVATLAIVILAIVSVTAYRLNHKDESDYTKSKK